MAKETNLKSAAKNDSGKIETSEAGNGEINHKRQMLALIERIDKGDPAPADLKALSKEFDRKPELYRSIGNLQSNVFSLVLNDAATSAFGRECVTRYAEEMKTELGYRDSTFVERMLIDEIVMRWLRLQTAESFHNNVISGTHALEMGNYADKRLTAAQKGYLRAIDTLARVRKMIAHTQAKGAEMFKNLMTAGAEK